MTNAEIKEFVKSRDSAVIKSFNGDFKDLYAHIAKYNGKQTAEAFESSSKLIRTATVCKMICNITTEEVQPYVKPAIEWLNKHNMQGEIQ